MDDSLAPGTAVAPEAANQSMAPADVYFAVPLHVAGTAATVVTRLALALEAAGVSVSLVPGAIAEDVDGHERERLEVMMRRPKGRRFHIHWSPCPCDDPPAELDSAVHAEFFPAQPPYAWRGVHDLDFATRQVVMNSRRKFTLGQRAKDALSALGVPAEQCVVLGIESLPASQDGIVSEASAHLWSRAAEILWQALLLFENEYRRTVAARTLAPVESGKISVVCATYNRSDALKKFFAAYHKQTLPKDRWEMILVDDASSYDVAELVRDHAAGLPVRLVQNAKNMGAGLARNRAIPLTTGDVILFTGDDIIPEENYLAEHLRVHRERDEPNLGVLGFIDWHADLDVSPLMAFITGEGGLQFCFGQFKAGSYVPTDNFYTSNVSVRRPLLVRQAELFSHRFSNYGFEDIELGVRLGRAGMRLLYHPAAHTTHLHPMTTRSVVERQYKVGRMLVVYLLLQPDQCLPMNRLYVRWLERAQCLAREPDVQAIAEDLKRLSSSLEGCLDAVIDAWQTLGAAFSAFATKTGRPRPSTNRLQNSLFALRLDLAQRAGMADEWMGVPAGTPNLVRDLTNLFTCTEIWRLFDGPHFNVPGLMPPPPTGAAPTLPQPATLARRMAKRLRRHPGLSPVWACLERLPGFSVAESAARGFLRKCA